ncbi:MAG: FHA domain-containing protein [candidate division Zixibacteria bacterium]|nr:FHA domain-containing protein [candidate division Zixibacteria bacterium]
MLKRIVLAAVGCMFSGLAVWGQPVAERSFDLTRLAPDLEKPVSLWADSAGGFWVGDGKSKRVFSFGPEGELRIVFGDKKKNKLGFPVSLFGERSGKMYILDSQERVVLIFDQVGNRLGQLGGSKTFARPLALSLDDSDNVYVVEEARKKILVFDAFKRPTASVESLSAGQFLSRPVSAATDRQGNLFVLDLGRRTVAVFDGGRRFLQEVSLAAEGKDFPEPVQLVSGPFGELFLLEAGEPAVWYLASWRTPAWKKILSGEKSGLKDPTALVVTRGGKLFVLDGGKKEIQKYSLKGLVEAVPEAVSEKPAAAKNFVTSLGDSGHLLVPYADFKKGLVLLQPFDASGNLADWLLESDIQIERGGEPVKFSSPISLLKSDFKLAVALVWAAGQLSTGEQEELKNAFVREVHPELDEPNDKLFLFAAAGRPEAVLEAEGNTRTAEMALQGLRLGSGELCYWDAVLSANQQLKERAPGLLPVVILVTDGPDGASSAGYLDILHLAEEKGFANIYAVALSRGEGGSYLADLRRVSETTRGIYFETPDVKNVSQIFARIIKTLKYQLVLRFTPGGGSGILNVSATLEEKTFSASSAGRPEEELEPAEEKSESSATKGLIFLVAGILAAALLAGILILFLVKRKGRKCPACGHKVEPAWTVCYFCKTPLSFAKSAKGPATLTIQKGRLAGSRFTLTDAVVTLGASQENQVVVDYEGVSRRHCRIEKNGGRWELVDLNSTNHTYLNGRPVSRAALKSRDVISLARVADMIFED